MPLALCLYRRHAVYSLLPLTLQGAESRNKIATQARLLDFIVDVVCWGCARAFGGQEEVETDNEQDSKGVARVMMQIDEIDFGRSRMVRVGN